MRNLYLLEIVTAVSILAILLIVSQPIVSNDFWWHLKLGQLMLDSGSLIKEEPFLFEYAAVPPVMHEWLFQVFIASVDQNFGLPGLRVFNGVMAGMLCLLVYVAIRAMGCSREVACIAVLLLVSFGFFRLIQLRPQLFSMVIFYCLLYLIYQYRFHLPKKALAIFAVLGALWANLHSVFVVIIPFWLWLICLHFFASARGGQSLDGNVARHLIALILFAGSALANPYGLGSYTYYFDHNKVNPASNIVDDFAVFNPFLEAAYLPSSSIVLRGVFALLIFATFLGVCNRLASSWSWKSVGRDQLKQMTLAGWAAGSICAAVLAVRFVWMLPLVVPFLACVAKDLPIQYRKKAFAVAPFAILMAVLFVYEAKMTSYITRFKNNNFFDTYVSGDHYDTRKFHHHAVNFLQHLSLKGNLYNPYDLGGYLAWRLNPQVKTFLDGRHDRHTKQAFSDYRVMATGQGDLGSAIEGHAFDMFFVPITHHSTNLRFSLELRGWKKIYHSRTSALYVPAGLVFSQEQQNRLSLEYPGLQNDDIAPSDVHRYLDQFVLTHGVNTGDPSQWSEETWRKELALAIEHLLLQRAHHLLTLNLGFAVPAELWSRYQQLESLAKDWQKVSNE